VAKLKMVHALFLVRFYSLSPADHNDINHSS
jgi:hypothetical protein